MPTQAAGAEGLRTALGWGAHVKPLSVLKLAGSPAVDEKNFTSMIDPPPRASIPPPAHRWRARDLSFPIPELLTPQPRPLPRTTA